MALTAICAALAWILYRLEILMATKQEFLDKITDLGGAVDNLRSDIAALKAQLAAGGLTAEEEAEVAAALDEKIAAAKALADEQ